MQIFNLAKIAFDWPQCPLVQLVKHNLVEQTYATLATAPGSSMPELYFSHRSTIFPLAHDYIEKEFSDSQLFAGDTASKFKNFKSFIHQMVHRVAPISVSCSHRSHICKCRAS